jgi:CMP-N,N'-diacetyllegionaminic acid synthase
LDRLVSPRTLGIIPARGGSKRLHRKNLRCLAGKPLIAHTIAAAQSAESLTDFLVSTDDAEIEEVARSHGAPVPFIRPPEISGDNVENKHTVVHSLQQMEAERPPYDIVVLLQPTSPIRDPRHIDEAVALLWNSELPTLASVKGPVAKKFPTLKVLHNNALENLVEISDRHPEPFFQCNASIYAAKCDYVRRTGEIRSERQVPLVMDALHSTDVDTEYDLYLAEAAMTWRASRTGSQ